MFINLSLGEESISKKKEKHEENTPSEKLGEVYDLFLARKAEKKTQEEAIVADRELQLAKEGERKGWEPRVIKKFLEKE